MDSVIDILIDTARRSPSIFTHAAILMMNKKPLRDTAAFNIGTDHAETRACERFRRRYDLRCDEKGQKC